MNRNNNININNNMSASYGMNVESNMDTRGTNFFNKNVRDMSNKGVFNYGGNNYPGSSGMYHGNHMNQINPSLCMNNVNMMNPHNMQNIQKNNFVGLFGEVKRNVPIFGNRNTNGPLFAKVDAPSRKNNDENFSLLDYVNADKSIFGNRLKENKSLFNKKVSLNNPFTNSFNNTSIEPIRNIIRKNSYGESNKENKIFIPGQMGSNQSTPGDNFFRSNNENRGCSIFDNKTVFSNNNNNNNNSGNIHGCTINANNKNGNSFFFNKGVTERSTFFSNNNFDPNTNSINSFCYMNNNIPPFQENIISSANVNNETFPFASTNFRNVMNTKSYTSMALAMNVDNSLQENMNSEAISNLMKAPPNLNNNCQTNLQPLSAVQNVAINQQNIIDAQFNNVSGQQNIMNPQMHNATNNPNAFMNVSHVFTNDNAVDLAIDGTQLHTNKGIAIATKDINESITTPTPIVKMEVGINQINRSDLVESPIYKDTTMDVTTIASSNDNSKSQFSNEQGDVNASEALNNPKNAETVSNTLNDLYVGNTGLLDKDNTDALEDKLKPQKKTVEIPAIYKNKIESEKEYIKSDKKRVSFFNDDFLKALEEKTVDVFNNYVANMSTIKTFPCLQIFDNTEFYRKVIEQCKKEERYEIDNELYEKTMSIGK